MLGLGNSLAGGGGLGGPVAVVYRYISDFTSGLDGWADNQEFGHTLEYNQTAPDSSTGWLKVTFDGSEVGNAPGIKNVDAINPTPDSGSLAFTCSLKIYLDSPATSGDLWTNDPMGLNVNVTGRGTFVSPKIDLESVQNIEFSSTTLAASANRDDVIMTFTSGSDRPLAGAVMYIKDIEIVLTE